MGEMESEAEPGREMEPCRAGVSVGEARSLVDRESRRGR